MTDHKQRELLPADVEPVHYRLFLEPDLEKYTYSGWVEIDLDVKASTNKVSVNANSLNIHKAEIDGVKAVGFTEDVKKQQITWECSKPLTSGSKAVLRVEFDGELNDKMCGFYRSVHKDSHGKEQVVATTQMEATECRRAFPCFDEPKLKATFDISIKADKKFTVLSNSSVKDTETLKDGKIVTHFNTTPKMSSYLVAFIVGELAYVESNLFRLPVRVYATPGMENKCQYAADLGARTLKFFEDIFKIEYPLPKCDMVGLHDFSSGAMENWGLITYRLTAIFYTEGQDSWSSKLRVTEVVQHELAHQWFGNLVTMDWWDGLWLNEGFATWMSWYACNAFYPEWKVWQTYLNQSYQSCLEVDGLRSSHPVEVPVHRAQDVDEIFDAISYLKGSCVIRMVSTILGEKTFIEGIATYLNRHKYGNTVTSDLWKALSDVSGQDVEGFMSVWTQKVGYPLLSVTESGTKNEIEVTQNRFLSTHDVKPEEDVVLYPVWLDILNTSGQVDTTQVLKSRSGTFKVESTDFLKLNANQNGIFRVKYSENLFSKIVIEGAKGSDSKLSTEDRIGFLGDLAALRGFVVPASQVLTVAKKWSTDPSPNVVLSILNEVATIASLISKQDDDLIESFKRFRAGFVVPIVDKLGLDFPAGADSLESQVRSTAFSHAIDVEDPKYVEVALGMFRKSKFDVIPDIRASIYRAVGRFGTKEEWDLLKQHYLDGANADSGEDALGALWRTNDINRIHELLQLVLNHSIRKQDSYVAMARAFSSSKMSGTETWKWFTSNWKQITEEFPVAGRILGNMIQMSVCVYISKQHLKNVDEFYKDKDISGNERVYATAHDLLEKKVSSLDHIIGDISRWLETESKF